jgi:hypothetical protein
MGERERRSGQGERRGRGFGRRACRSQPVIAVEGGDEPDERRDGLRIALVNELVDNPQRLWSRATCTLA